MWGRASGPAPSRHGERLRSWLPLQELAPDPHVAPPRVLPAHAQDQLSNLGVEAWASRRAMRSGPLLGDEPAVPAEQSLRSYEERTPSLSR
jgi:hypothetical protein